MMMPNPDEPLWTTRALADVTAGRWIGADAEPGIQGVELLPRRVEPGDLLIVTSVARWGRRYSDTIGSLATAKARGAVAAMADELPDAPAPDLPILQVDNTRRALTKLATFARGRLSGTVVGITGSVGKTTTREMTQLVLGRQGTVSATESNSNTSPGVALSVAQTPPDAEFVVYELAHGGLSAKAQLARPHAALITEVALAHLEELPSLEAVIDHKAGIFDGLEPEGTAILNRDSAGYDRLKDHLDRRGIGKRILFGAHPASDVRLRDWHAAGKGSAIEVTIRGAEISYDLRVAGLHMIMSSLAALSAVVAVGGDPSRAAADLADFTALAGRMEELELEVAAGRVDLIDDSFNANPASMVAALSVLASRVPGGSGRRIAVLGEMKELGPESERLHAELAEPVLAADVARVYTLGDGMRALRRSLPPRLLAPHSESVDELERLLRGELAAGDVVLVKGSHGSHVGQVVRRLRRRSSLAGPADQ